MRELEFLPEWYPLIRRKRRLLVLHGWLLVVIVATVGTWLLLAQRNVRDKESQLICIKGQIVETQSKLAKLDRMLAMQRDLGHQEQIFNKLGKHIEASRLVSALDRMMPPAMALMSVSIENEEQLPPAGSLAAAKAAQDSTSPPVRKMKVKLQALVPTDEELATFLSKLTGHPFEQVALAYTRQRIDNGHLMREFEVAFSLDLNSIGGE